jgi:MFS transporter, SP family, sugar:H+ symporter
MQILGGSIGALMSGNFAYLGRRTCLLLGNVVIIVSSSLTLLPNFTVLCFGRFLYGLGIGVLAVFVPKFIVELAPQEISGPAGAIMQVGVCSGILLAFLVGLGVGDHKTAEIDSFAIEHYWRIIFALPILLSVIQSLLLVFVYPYDTPVMLKQWKQEEKLN